MRKYIREMLQDLTGRRSAAGKSTIPSIPKAPAPDPAMPGDLNNQELSKDPLQRTRQLDYQAQRDEERQTS
jgi:hypothetical protein